MHFLSLRGNSYDIGFQHGEKLKYLIQSAIRQRCRFFHKNQRPGQTVLKERTKSLEVEFPELMEEIRGISDGAECSLHDILIYNLSPLPASCSNLVLLCDEGGPMLGHVNDDRDGTFDVAFHIHLNSGMELLCIGSAGSVGIGAAINSYGLAVSHACARSKGLKNARAILNLALFRRVLIERSRDCQEAELFLSTHSFSTGADNIIGVDKTGAAFVAEKLPMAVGFRRLHKGAIYCTGRPLIPEIRQFVDQETYEKHDDEIIRKLINRELYFEAVITKKSGSFSLELMKEVLLCMDEGVEICNEMSNWATILFPEQFEMLVADRFPCDNDFKRFGEI